MLSTEAAIPSYKGAMMIRPLFVLAAASFLSSCGSMTPGCDGSDPRSLVKALDAEGLLGVSLVDLAPETLAELKARSDDPSGFVDRFEAGMGKFIDLDNPDLEEELVSGYAQVDPSTRAAMCDALNGKDREAIMRMNADLAPILGPEAMPIVEAAGADLLRILEQDDEGE